MVRMKPVRNASYVFTIVAAVSGMHPMAANAASCMDQYEAQQQRLQSLQARMDAEPSICRKCQVLGEAFEQHHAFLEQCPEADPTGETRQGALETLGGLKNCVSHFC